MPVRLTFFASRCQQTCTGDESVQALKKTSFDPMEYTPSTYWKVKTYSIPDFALFVAI